MGYILISGSAVTPAWAPTLSLIERVMAKPGACIYDSHTLYGPTGFPCRSNFN